MIETLTAPAASLVGGSLSGWILASLSKVGGWAGWQWLYVLEALPVVLLGIAFPFILSSNIRSAPWLNEDEKRVLEDDWPRTLRLKALTASGRR